MSFFTNNKNIFYKFYFSLLGITLLNVLVGFDTNYILPTLIALASIFMLFMIILNKKHYGVKGVIIASVIFLTVQATGWAIPHLYGYYFIQHDTKKSKEDKKQDNIILRQHESDCLYKFLQEYPQARGRFIVAGRMYGRRQIFKHYFTPLKIVYRETIKPDMMLLAAGYEMNKIRLELKEDWVYAALQTNTNQTYKIFSEMVLKEIEKVKPDFRGKNFSQANFSEKNTNQ